MYLGDEQTQVAERGQDLRAKEESPKDEKQLASKLAWRMLGKGATVPVCPSGRRSAELPNHSLLHHFVTHSQGSLLRLDEAVMLMITHDPWAVRKGNVKLFTMASLCSGLWLGGQRTCFTLRGRQHRSFLLPQTFTENLLVNQLTRK